MSWKKVSLPNMFQWEKEGEQLEGVYRNIKENVGDNDSNVYTIRENDGTDVGFWGSTVLDTQMKQVEIGQRIRVTFLGWKDSPNRKGKQYKDFEVEFDDSEESENTAL